MDLRQVILVATLTVAAIIGVVKSYPNNVPSSPDICSKMTPGHGPRPQKTQPPYQIILNKFEMQGGNNLQIVLQGEKGQTFRGFYIQVRDQDGLPIGTFLVPDEKEAGVHSCFHEKKNAAHHKNRNEKESITVYWKAPESLNGKVKVQATVLKDFETYWVDVKAPELVSVVRDKTSHFFTSSGFPEKRKTETTKTSKATRILNYNPYSPYSPISSFWDDNRNSSSREFLRARTSEESTVEPRERQLFGYPSFDFHDSLYSPKVSPPRKSKNVQILRPDHPKIPFRDQADHVPLYRPSTSELNKPYLNSVPETPKGSLLYNKLGNFNEKHSGGFYQNPKVNLPFSYPPPESPYYYQNSQLNHAPAPLFPNNAYENKPEYSPLPHLSQSIQHDKGSHYHINHHYLQNPPIKPNYPKPASDLSYPNSGYFPKDILTKLTSYIPNIYNALTNNPLFNFNVDNTIESIWKPVKGVPTKYDSSVAGTSTAASMPKYGYLVYNPVRKNPYFVIPAADEEEFVASHMNGVNHHGRRNDAFSYN